MRVSNIEELNVTRIMGADGVMRTPLWVVIGESTEENLKGHSGGIVVYFNVDGEKICYAFQGQHGEYVGDPFRDGRDTAISLGRLEEIGCMGYWNYFVQQYREGTLGDETDIENFEELWEPLVTDHLTYSESAFRVNWHYEDEEEDGDEILS